MKVDITTLQKQMDLGADALATELDYLEAATPRLNSLKRYYVQVAHKLGMVRFCMEAKNRAEIKAFVLDNEIHQNDSRYSMTVREIGL